MNVSKPVFLSAILISIVGTAAAFPLVLDVYVTNFPLDEQGNLRVSSDVAASKVITVVKDSNLSWTGGEVSKDDDEYFTVDVAGYNELVIYASFKSWKTLDERQDYSLLVVGFIVDGIRCMPAGLEHIYGHILAGNPSHPRNHTALYHIIGSEVKLCVSAGVGGTYPAGWMLVDVSLYLRN